jgi:AraC-like DNA-binding protein
MKVLHDPVIQSGFLYEDPVEDIPAITHCGEAVTIPGAQLASHQHKGFEFLYVLRGTVTWKVGNSAYAQKMGDLFVAYPDEPHSSAKFREGFYHFWIGLELEKLGPEGVRVAELLRNHKVRLLHNCLAVEAVLRAIVGAVVTPLPLQRKVIRAHLSVLLTLIEQSIAMTELPGSIRKNFLPYSYPIQKAISYMQRNLHRPLYLSDLAKVATTRDPSYFCARFRREVAVPPAAYHMQLRLDAARASLLQPSMTITTAASQYGFSSPQHFSTLFRRAFGITPKKWIVSQADKN